MVYKHEGGRIYDMITSERVDLGEMIMDTEIKSMSFNPIRNQRTMFIKESTIVWLAEKAGYTLTKRDAGNSEDTEVVDGTDAIVGGGEATAGKAKAGGRKAAK